MKETKAVKVIQHLRNIGRPCPFRDVPGIHHRRMGRAISLLKKSNAVRFYIDANPYYGYGFSGVKETCLWVALGDGHEDYCRRSARNPEKSIDKAIKMLQGRGYKVTPP